MPKITLNNIELPATDLDVAKQFYEDAFGWSFIDYGPTYAAAQLPGMEIGFSTDASVAAAPPYGAESSTGPLLLLQTADLGAAYRTLTEKKQPSSPSHSSFRAGVGFTSATRAATSWAFTHSPNCEALSQPIPHHPAPT
ncbi:VOC family protein [Ornithinimicrobium sp. INDO-MA30-4]|uniref:VOC family protein n=1 Tax=Ornithinimicrobium sp. INDO-MA30-4 TaxID=2908651 RepID=UPI001F17753F|nr:VOC family protein [Ornithinimicrobium sp. INDO-MA30-4]UJH70381.1 hypothetical protein L0A91_14805 [Ornithinimicrobium sp. INDO-MA30-4]